VVRHPHGLQRAQLADITSRNAALAEVHRMKETFRDLYRQPDLTSAKGFLKGWIATAMNSKLKPLVKAAKSINNRAAGILRWYTTRMTNAVLEGMNSLLQAAKRKARGYRLHKTFITMACLIAGKLDLRAPSPFGSCLHATH
jgi:transposase